MGGDIKNYIVHIVGGSKSLILGSRAWEENINIAKEILIKYKIPITTIDIGGEKFRKVVFNNLTGEIVIKKGDT
jgi:chemotaxis protein CheD